jgi:hypothetical protein
MAKRYPIPNMDNMTDGGLVDILADWREKEAEAKFYVGFYKEALKARMADKKSGEKRVMEGEKFVAEITTSVRTTLKTTEIWAAAEAGDEHCKFVCAKYMNETVVETLRTIEKAKTTI